MMFSGLITLAILCGCMFVIYYLMLLCDYYTYTSKSEFTKDLIPFWRWTTNIRNSIRKTIKDAKTHYNSMGD